jgi:hypothetical protein
MNQEPIFPLENQPRPQIFRPRLQAVVAPIPVEQVLEQLVEDDVGDEAIVRTPRLLRRTRRQRNLGPDEGIDVSERIPNRRRQQQQN